MEHDIFDRTWAMVMQWRRDHPEDRPKDYRWVAAPFGFPEPPDLQWRLSSDVRAKLDLAFDGELAWKSRDFGFVQETLYSIPLTVDGDLPPNSVILGRPTAVATLS